MERKRFELGKCYQHHSGSQLHICGIADTVFYGLTFIAENGYNREVLHSKQVQWDNHKPTDGEVQGPRPGSEGWSNQFSSISMTNDATENYFEIPMSEFVKNNTSK